jgi:hypothetical protein
LAAGVVVAAPAVGAADGVAVPPAAVFVFWAFCPQPAAVNKTADNTNDSQTFFFKFNYPSLMINFLLCKVIA